LVKVFKASSPFLQAGAILYLLAGAVIPQLDTGGTIGTGQTLILITFGLLGFVLACVAIFSSFYHATELALVSTIFFGLALLGEGSGWSVLIPVHLVAGWLLTSGISGSAAASEGRGEDDSKNGTQQ